MMVESRFRNSLLGITIVIFIGTTIELWLTDHTEETLQLFPFGLSAFGFIAVMTMWLNPSRLTIRILRFVMIIVGVGSLMGIGFHLNGNFAFELEMRPGANAGDVVMEAFKGINPLLAPGILALASILASLATYYHPLLNGGVSDETA